MAVDIALLIGGVTILAFSADRMVLATASLASHWGVAPVIVGALIIGFGSSLPELLVSMLALDQPNGLDLAVGNAVGSNIANISLVLAISVIFFPIARRTSVVVREGYLMLAGLIMCALVLWDAELSLMDGLILLLGLVVAALLITRWSRSDRSGAQEPEVLEHSSIRRQISEAVIGLVAVVAGARAMVVGAESIALEIGLAEGVVGLTILALGTSLPELGTALASARRGQNQLVLGNVLGSNIFNSLGVVGAAASLGSGSLVADFRPDLALMVVVAILAGLAARSGDRLRRLEGVVLLGVYPLAVLLAL